MRNFRLIALLVTATVLIGGCNKPRAKEATVSNEVLEVANPSQIKSPTEITSIETSLVESSTSDLVYTGEAYIAVNDNIPYFTDEEKKIITPFENYSQLDRLGRCGVAYANICVDLMPTDEREAIGSVKPSGWQSTKYDFVSGKYLYNRCHLIGFQLAGENANEQNLITGTRYLNIEGMLPFENLVADYVKETSNHVLYRVTPTYTGDNLVADGLYMEGWSVEDEGDGVCFNVYCFNVQPGVVINYADGTSQEGDPVGISVKAEQPKKSTELTIISEHETYILNTNSRKIHKKTCSEARRIKKENKEVYRGRKEYLLDKGYKLCHKCNP